MSFLSDKYYPIHYKQMKKQIRKEFDSFMARCEKIFSQNIKERASSFTSKASITVEAAIAASLFFFAVMCIACLFEIMVLQIQVKSALHSAGKEIAMEACINPFLLTGKLEREIVETIGDERLDRSFIIGGRNGIDCSNSKTYAGSTIMDLCAYYQIEIPFMMFRIPIIAREEIIRIKGWSGAEDALVSKPQKEIVYVTEHGIVYHKKLDCTYLELSIKAVPMEQIDKLRNENGGKYYKCESCGNKLSEQKNVYITDHGERYHCSLDCDGLERNIYAVLLSDVYGMGGCSKCVK